MTTMQLGQKLIIKISEKDFNYIFKISFQINMGPREKKTQQKLESNQWG